MRSASKLAVMYLAAVVCGAAEGATYTVTNLNDSGAGSFRQAIVDVWGNPGPDTVEFTVAGTITILSTLPDLGDTSGGAKIDGTTAPGYAGTPVVVLNGPGTASYAALKIISANNQVSALQIANFQYGIWIDGAAASGNTVSGCYIGTDGTSAAPNLTGILISSAPGNLIGTNATAWTMSLSGT